MEEKKTLWENTQKTSRKPSPKNCRPTGFGEIIGLLKGKTYYPSKHPNGDQQSQWGHQPQIVNCPATHWISPRNKWDVRWCKHVLTLWAAKLGHMMSHETWVQSYSINKKWSQQAKTADIIHNSFSVSLLCLGTFVIGWPVWVCNKHV